MTHPGSSGGLDAVLAYEHNGQRVPRERFYAVACDPHRSVAVEACAGAGKTWMLVSRMLRALLEGAQPQEILAITFTKKAAGEMRERLHHWLAEFASATPDALQRALVERGVRAADAPQWHDRLRGLYRALLSAGRPVQVRTFHSWFAALLRNAPLSVLERMGLPSSYELLEDDSEAVAQVWRRFHGAVAADPAARTDFETAVAAHGRSQTQKGLQAALDKRVEFTLAARKGVVATSVSAFGQQFPAFAALSEPEMALAGPEAQERWLARARALGAEKNLRPQKAAAKIVDAFATPDLRQRFSMLRGAFFVAHDDRLDARLERFTPAREAESELQALCAAVAQHQAWLHQQRMARLARLLIEQFAQLKRERGWVDMNDLEQAALVLLGDPVLSGWVQERLDARVRHLLIDEFQDTNPLQWQALYSWLSSYAGAGSGSPSVFVVGDPKQSIYRFRRAEPQVFRAAQHFVATGLGGDLLSCDHTHRNAPEIVHVVNHVMGAAQAAGEYEGFRPHTTQATKVGRVLRLPAIQRSTRTPARGSDAESGEEISWRDSLTVPRELPEEKLVTLECRQAAAWIAGRVAQGTAPGDIMVLARKRDRLAVMEDELRLLRIASQQPEKTLLGEAPEVQDLVALFDVLVSPAHDLSLARVLKSPLLCITDEGLVQIALRVREARAEQRALTWFEVLQDPAMVPPALASAAASLLRWKGWVDRLPPHDALSAIFDDGDVLARYAQAAPPPLRDAMLANLRALLGAALQVQGARYLTPYAFVRALKTAGVRGPAAAQAGAVRLLTVHGAKGLEAPCVLMLDTDGAGPRAENMGAIVDWPGAQEAPVRFAFIASETRPPPCSSAPLAVEQAAREREELNALYVALTRARTELVLSSVEPNVAARASWWQRVAPLCQPVDVPAEGSGSYRAPAEPIRLQCVPRATAASGSSLALAEHRDAGTPQSRFGEAVHRLLETWGPQAAWPASQLSRVKRQFLLDEPALRDAVAMAMRILSGEGAWAWDPEAVDWQANEVELHHDGELLRLDRLVRRRADGHWWVLDFKSAARPEQDAELLAKMRRYRAAVASAYPAATVKAAFLTGQGRLVPVA